MKLTKIDRARVVRLAEYQGRMRFPILNEVEAYWDALRSDGAAPRRADVDPRGLERALPHAFMLERVAPGVLRFRLAGRALSDLMGMDVRGMPLSALFTAPARDELAQIAEAVFTRPQSLRLSLDTERGLGRPPIEAELLLLPLMGDDGQVDRALGALAYDGTPGATPRRLRITGATTRALDSPVPVRHGFSEDPANFTPPPPTRPTPAGRPALKLVKPED